MLNAVIVRHDGDDLLLVTQPDHAALSGRIMAAWKGDGLPAHPIRETVLLATREHDNGWLELDDRPGRDAASGRPQHWAHSRFPGHALTPTGVMAIRCKQFHLPDL